MARKSHQPKSQKPASAAASKETVSREVANLGKKVGEAIKAVANSKEVREFQSEVVGSVKRVGGKLIDAVKNAKASEHPDDVARQLKKVFNVGRKRGLETGEAVRENLVSGLREIGNELARIASRLEKR